MMTCHHKVYAQKGKYQHPEADDGHNGGASPPPPHRQPFVQQNRVKQPGDTGPYFFWVPAPKPAPDSFGVNKAGYQPQGEHAKAHDNANIADVVQLL